jgi:AGZA family xanthine/uracil permease-like MFS transporter
MAYIAVVNPLILADAGMPKEAVAAATCLAAAFGSILMGRLTNYPFALAPGMGLNAFFTYTVVIGMGLSWQGALAAVFVSGVLFLALTLTGARQAIVNALPLSLKCAISVGIGLFIALIGLKNAGLIVYHPATGSLGLVHGGYFADPELGKLLPPGTSPQSIGVALFGLVVTGLLLVRQVPGALLLGIAASFLLAAALGMVQVQSRDLVGLPSGLDQTLLAMDFAALLSYGLVPVLITFTFVDLFDTVGTLVGVASKTDLLDAQGRLPRAGRALLADALATIFGASVGTSTTTTYVESAAGVAAGGRSGLTAMVVGGFFLLALFLAPLVELVPAAATAPALVFVGVFMMEPVKRIDFADYREAVPAFLTMVVMPLAFSIAEGIVAGVLSCALVHLASGQARQLSPALWVLALLFALRFFLA